MSSAPEETMEDGALKKLNEEVAMSELALKERAAAGAADSEESETVDDVPIKKDTAVDDSDDDDEEIVLLRKRAYLFHHMATHPWFYMLFWPVLFSVLIGFGWTQDDIIEDEVTNIWIPTSGSYSSDVAYAASLGEEDLASTNFAAMSIARDGKNLFTESRLEEIRSRMEKAEKTTIEHKGVTYNWEDFCASNAGFPYEFPCARLSPMDLFQEARWYMDYKGPESTPVSATDPAPKQDLYRRTWYKDLIQAKLVQPRIPRFGVMTNLCPTQCQDVLGFRLLPTSPGYSPFSLFADIGNLEMNDPCRMCIEFAYHESIVEIYEGIIPTFQVIAAELARAAAASTDSAKAKDLADLAGKAAQLATTLTTNDVTEFYFYYVTRGVYAELGTSAYVANYQNPFLQAALATCQQFGAALGLVCPDSTTVTAEEAKAALLRHADNTFSSVTTAGAPFPLWSEGDGTGALFRGSSPVGGSGIDMSQDLRSAAVYLNITLYGQPGWSPMYDDGAAGFADPTSATWKALMDKNPTYAWFMAGITDADPSTTSCGNGFLKGTDLEGGGILDEVNQNSTLLAMGMSQSWCTQYSIPNTDNPGEGSYTKQHFARMFYDRLVDSGSFLGLSGGVDDPYSWTTGQGCGYDLKGERNSYTGMSEESILYNASRELYFIDEGESVGVVSPELLIGDVTPPVGEYSFDNPLQEVGVVQTLYAALLPKDIVQRVRHCKRPDGPIDITIKEAEEILFDWKEAMENTWTEGWDDGDAGEVQFVGFFDDNSVVGTTGRMLEEITLDNNVLTSISILLIALFSALFLFNWDWVESRVLITLIGVALVVIAFFGALGFAILVGVKISVTIAWTLPFVILGLGVDDMYIVLMAIKKQGGYGEKHYLQAMKEVVVPVTMTSLVNASMFAILNLSDIPAIYITAQVADYSVIALYCLVIFCFPAFCFLDMKRQAAGRKDVIFCSKQEGPLREPTKEDFRSIWLYDKFYEPLILGKPRVRMVSHLVIWVLAAALFGTGAYGITERKVGLGLEDFFPKSNPAGTWATKRTASLASWSIGMNWGALDYTDATMQMRMIKQFEGVITTEHVADVDTKLLWMGDLLMWTTRHCTENFDRPDFDVLACGRDKVFSDDPDSTCKATWKENTLGLREKVFSDITDPICYPHEGGICRPGDRMHPLDLVDLGLDPALSAEYSDLSFCPTADGWTDEQWQFCLVEWRNTTGFSGGRFILEDEHGSTTECAGDYNNDEEFKWPIPFSSAPTMFSFDLFSHEDTLEMMSQTRSLCDDNGELHCWLTGIPYDYWTQYEDIFEVLLGLGGYAIASGFLIAFLFLFVKLSFEKRHAQSKVFWGSLIGAALIAVTMILSLVTVIGLSILSGVSLTGFSNMSFVLSVGFAVEYSVHIVQRWLRADLSHESGLDRVKFTMSFLMLPTFMSFVSSTIGVVCLAFTDFEFNQVFFFRPLIIVMMTTYFYGCWWLPVMLTLLNFDVVKLGKPAQTSEDGSIAKSKSDSDPMDSVVEDDGAVEEA